MKNKALVILAASAAALGSAIFAAPANAVQQEVEVQVTIQPALYLRTFKTIKLDITQGDLAKANGGTLKESDFMGDEGVGGSAVTTGEQLINNIRSGGIGGGGTADTVTKTVKQLYAVWGNTAAGKSVTVTVTPVVKDLLKDGTSTTEKITLDTITPTTGSFTTGAVNSTTTGKVGGIDMTFKLNGAGEGTYTGGKISVNAVVP
jgi:hypothetical protein